MKKVCCCLFAVVLLLSSVSGVQAAENDKSKREVYATTEDMLLSMIHQPVEKMVQKEYGKRMEWSWQRITEVHRVFYTEKRPNPSRWYEVKVAINIKDFDKKGWNVDTLTLKFIPNQSKDGRADMNDLGDTQVKLIDYEHTAK